MGLTPTLDSVEALFRKLEREAYRAFHAPRPIHQADHFYNFCITAHAMRDYFLERHAALKGTQRQRYEDAWKQRPLLVAVKEIANSSKHFQLRHRRGGVRPAQTPSVRQIKSGVVDIFMNQRGDLRAVPIDAPDISVRLSDGTRYQLYEFTTDVLSYWRGFLTANGIRVRRQPFAVLAGEPVSHSRSRATQK